MLIRFLPGLFLINNYLLIIILAFLSCRLNSTAAEPPCSLGSTLEVNKLPELNPEAYYQLGVKRLEEKLYQKALNNFNKCLELNPNHWEASYQKALIFQLTGYDDFAIARYKKLLAVKPAMAEAHVNLGLLYKGKKDFKAAQEELAAAINLNYFSLPAHYNLANLFLEGGQLEQALKEYKICLKLVKDNALVHNNIGVLYLRRNYLEEAYEQFLKASHLDPANSLFQNNLNQASRLLNQKSPNKKSAVRTVKVL